MEAAPAPVNMALDAQAASTVLTNVPMDSQPSPGALGTALGAALDTALGTAEEERLRRQLRELEELAAQKEQEREQVCVLCCVCVYVFENCKSYDI